MCCSAGSWFVNPAARGWTCDPAPAGVRSFHLGLADYAPTPLVDLPALAHELGVRRVVAKDESSRLGLPAFKGLGVSYAIYRLVCERAGGTVKAADWDGLREAIDTLPPLELVTATDGNHGRAVARFARVLGIAAHVFVPDVVTPGAIEAIRAEGAQVTVLSVDYDETVRRAAAEAERREQAVLIQDTAWPGYETVPQWIVDGYSTLLAELDEQLGEDSARPRLVVTPMGVGSLAQAVVAHNRSSAHASSAAILGVEPDTAACILASLRDDQIRSVTTSSTIMDGLNCGTPSTLAWPYLRQGMDAVVTVSDSQAVDAVRTLGGLGVAAGPCGAATLAAARLAAEAADRRAALDIGQSSTIILLNTEHARPTAKTNR